jgi:hypothetical protein
VSDFFYSTLCFVAFISVVGIVIEVCRRFVLHCVVGWRDQRAWSIHSAVNRFIPILLLKAFLHRSSGEHGYTQNGYSHSAVVLFFVCFKITTLTCCIEYRLKGGQMQEKTQDMSEMT